MTHIILAIITALSLYSAEYARSGGKEVVAILPISLILAYLLTVKNKNLNLLMSVFIILKQLYDHIYYNAPYFADQVIRRNHILCVIFSVLLYLLKKADLEQSLSILAASMLFSYSGMLLLHI